VTTIWQRVSSEHPRTAGGWTRDLSGFHCYSSEVLEASSMFKTMLSFHSRSGRFRWTLTGHLSICCRFPWYLCLVRPHSVSGHIELTERADLPRRLYQCTGREHSDLWRLTVGTVPCISLDVAVLHISGIYGCIRRLRCLFGANRSLLSSFCMCLFAGRDRIRHSSVRIRAHLHASKNESGEA